MRSERHKKVKCSYIYLVDRKLPYCTDGDGEPLLLLHQTLLSSDEYALMMPILSREYRVIDVDTPGRGNSDKAPRKYQIEDYARAIISFLDTLGINKSSIVGHHTGVAIAVEVAVTDPERVDKLTLSGCPYFKDETRAKLLRGEGLQHLVIKEDGSHLLKMWEIVRSISPDSRPEVWNKVVAHYLKAGEHAEG